MDANPASEIMKGLPSHLTLSASEASKGIRVKLVTRPNIPVAWSHVHQHIPLLLDEVQPDLVLHIGLYSGRPDLWSIEYSAPLHGYALPDVNGHKWHSLNAEVPGQSDVPAEDMPKSLHTTLDQADITNRWQRLCAGLSMEINQPCSGSDRNQKRQWKAEVGATDGVGAFLCGFIYYTSMSYYYLRARQARLRTDRTLPVDGTSGKKQETGRPVLFMHTPECPTEAHIELGRVILINLLQAMVESYIVDEA